jgi:hypothetical protein
MKENVPGNLGNLQFAGHHPNFLVNETASAAAKMVIYHCTPLS